MSDDFSYYPKARLALGNGDLMDVTNVKHSIKNGGKIQATLRRNPSGVTTGVKESTLSFDGIVSEQGYERDYLTMVKNGVIKQLRLKVPGETLVFTGIPTERSTENALEDAIKFSVEWIGKTE